MKPEKYIEQCLWCDAVAEFWCDHMIGWARERGAKVISSPIDGWTCDAPMCAEHRQLVGFMCGKQVDTIDACPLHTGYPGPSRDILATPRTEQESEAERRKLRANVRRARISCLRGGA